MNRRDFFELFGAAALLPPFAWGASPDHPRLPIGMNLAPVADWEPGFPFRNLMWGARLWMTRNAASATPWDTSVIDRIPLDGNGYPLELPVRLAGMEQAQTVFALIPNVRRPGRYVLLHDGDGDFEGVRSTRVVEMTRGRVILEMKNEAYDPNNRNPEPEGFRIIQSRRGNHVRNIRIVALADEKADLERDPFLPEFIEFCRPFHALRFMDWMRTNGSLEKEWSNRKKRSFYTMAGLGGDADGFTGSSVAASHYLLSGGVAIEICIDLCNRLGVDAWFCVPHRATDDYIESFARLVRDRLDPRLKVYCEFSNEIWNRSFVQSRWALASPVAAAPLEAAGLKPWSDAARRKGASAPERAGVLFRRCHAIWEAVFAGPDRRRLVTVCAVQHAAFDAARRTLKYCQGHGGVDALAPGGYFGPEAAEYTHWKERGAALTAEEVIADLKTSLRRDSTRWTRNLAALSQASGVGYLVYEGGQHVQPEDAQELDYMPALAAAQKHRGMHELYMENFRLHSEAGCKLFCAYSSVSRQGMRFGSWGHAERYGQPLAETPKLRAVLEANIVRTKPDS
jgi:hypothetical protein